MGGDRAAKEAELDGLIAEVNAMLDAGTPEDDPRLGAVSDRIEALESELYPEFDTPGATNA